MLFSSSDKEVQCEPQWKRTVSTCNEDSCCADDEDQSVVRLRRLEVWSGSEGVKSGQRGVNLLLNTLADPSEANAKQE